jgi:NAD(P)-dependent dehydrogenase (short-subunit alcohol dehydrogenase family)
MDSKQKTVVITGGNSGLGYKTARNIAKLGAEWSVVIACRNPERAEAAAQALTRESGNPNIRYMFLNLASLLSVRKFADDFREASLPPLYGLVCNAAGQGAEKTNDGFEMTFGVCHLGHFLLTNLLLPQVAENGRIVFVASDMHNPPRMFGKPVYNGARELAFPTEDKGMMKYAMSKLCNIYTAYELAAILRESGSRITANAFNPAFMNDTGSGEKTNVGILLAKNVVGPLMAIAQGRLGSSEKSSAALCEMITGEKYEGVSGKYIDRGKDTKSSALSYNEENWRDLWDTSLKLVGLE